MPSYCFGSKTLWMAHVSLPKGWRSNAALACVRSCANCLSKNLHQHCKGGSATQTKPRQAEYSLLLAWSPSLVGWRPSQLETNMCHIAFSKEQHHRTSIVWVHTRCVRMTLPESVAPNSQSFRSESLSPGLGCALRNSSS